MCRSLAGSWVAAARSASGVKIWIGAGEVVEGLGSVASGTVGVVDQE